MKFLELFKKNKKNLGFIILIDLIFLILISFLGFYAYAELLFGYEAIDVISQDSDFTAESEEEMGGVQQKLDELNIVLNGMIKSVIYFLLFSFIAFSLLIGLSSLLCYRFLNEKKVNFKYFLKFSGLSLIWFLVFSLIVLLLTNVFNETLRLVLFSVIFIFLFYFASVSFSVFLIKDRIKESLKKVYFLGVKKFMKIFPCYFIGVVSILIIGWVMTRLAEKFEIFSLIGILLLIVSFVALRVSILDRVKELLE